MEEHISRDMPLPVTGTEESASSASANPVRVENVRRPNKTRARIVQIVSLVLLVLALVLLWRFLGDRAATPGAGRGGRGGGGESVPVEVAPVTQQDVPIQIKGIGNVEAVTTVAVRSQVEGTLLTVGFAPGQEVKKGQVLFTIDARPLQAQLSQAEANLLKAMAAVRQANDIVARDEAIAANNRVAVNRDLKLVEAGVIPREQYDNDLATLRAAEATVRADQSSVANLQAAQKAEDANVQNARVQLSYTTIRAPLAGKTGNLVVTAGNLVRANDTTPMVTITTSSPIYVTFSVPERDLVRIRQTSGKDVLAVQGVIPGDEANPVMGKLSLVDNTVDPATGTVRLKATFINEDRRLYPGQFVNVVLTLGTASQATVVPSQAVQIGQDKSFVYVAKADGTAEMRTVKSGTTMDSMTVIEEGLKPGEQVITDGQLRLVPGSKIQIKGPGQPGRGQGGGQGQGGPPGGDQNQGSGQGSGERRGGGGGNQNQ
ncbi:MAG TPA: efflux RND transporter periplasmic adaptor subunit [Pyrinomonadaceae bacterium]|jgi:multidrug efflux system membrane fusion protein|nr:efflux RND transporter periplasmic adaptor subunit [Pyrinomonadaceae bacterium]